jgi:hypothetical protein
MPAKSVSGKVASESSILGLVQAQSKTSEDLSERLANLEELVDKQEGRNQNVVYAVLFALAFIVITVAVEVILSNRQDASSMSDFYNKVDEMRTENSAQNQNIQQLNQQFELLHAKNSYLK